MRLPAHVGVDVMEDGGTIMPRINLVCCQSLEDPRDPGANGRNLRDTMKNQVKLHPSSLVTGSLGII